MGVAAFAVTVFASCFVGCTYRSVRLFPSPPLTEAPGLERLRVGVEAAVGVPAETASRFASDLRRTGVFGQVLAAADPQALDLVAEVGEASGVARCGTPDALSRMTLGLWHGSTSYLHRYRVVFRGEPAASPVALERDYLGTMASGLLSLPRRASRRWSRWPRGGTPAVVIDALRRDLAGAAPELLRLAGGAESSSSMSGRPPEGRRPVAAGPRR